MVIKKEILLKQIAYAVKQDLDKEDLIFRLGGDEFVLVFGHKNTKDSAKFLIENQKIYKSCKLYTINLTDFHMLLECIQFYQLIN